LIGGRAGHAAPGRAGARLAGVLCTKVAVEIARRPIRLGRVAALTGLRIARPRVVALIRIRADDRVRSRADARLTAIALRAEVPVVAPCPVGLRRVAALSGG